MSSTVEQIKEKLSIVDVVSTYLKLDKAGANFKACCPFHNEKTPSFFISPDRGTFHCFGCDKGGDIFSFVQDIEGLDFMGALKVLADKAGVEVRQVSTGEKKEKERLIALMDHAAFYYQSLLAKNTEALGYLKKRGVTIDTIKSFRIGFAPEGWRSVSTFLLEKGFTQAELEKAGLIIVKDGRFYDRFRSRIMFPIADASGRVIAFSGRIYGDESAESAKYINSPETELYRKSKVLYAFDAAKVAIRKEDRCVLVEGQMDVVMSHQAGVTNTVASSGTALTADQLTLISRLTHNLTMAFDADAAGMAASGRGIDLALAQDFDVRLVQLPEGTDPADLVVDDPHMWKKAVREAQPIIDFYLDTLKEKYTDERDYRRQVEKLVLPYVLFLPSKIDQAHYIARIAEAIHIGEEPVWEEFRRLQREQTAQPSGFMSQGASSTSHTPPPAPPQQDTRQVAMENRLLGLLLWHRQSAQSGIDTAAIEGVFQDSTGKPIEERIQVLTPPDCERMIFEAEAHFNNSEELAEEVNELIGNLREHLLRGQLMQAMGDLRRAETAGEKERVAQLLEVCHTISKDINTLTSQKNNRS